MKVEYNEETSVRKSLSFEVEQEMVDREIEARARTYAAKAKLPGFRAGKVPASVVRRRFRAQILEDVAESLVKRFVFPELEGRGLRPLAPPRVHDIKIQEGQPMTFRAVFETLPLFELPEYRGLPLTTREPKVTEQDVDRELEGLREQSARYEPVEGRPAQIGDFVLLDIASQPERGQPDRNDDTLLELGSQANPAELNAALAGMSPGEAKTVQVAYGEKHPVPALAGRRAEHTLTLKAIKRKILPDIDDELAKDFGDFSGLAELREKLRASLLEADRRKIDREEKNALVAALVQKADFEVPETLVEHHMSARTEGVARTLAFQGVDPSQVGVDWKDYRESQREVSLKAARADILLDEIARREGLEATEAELEAQIAGLAERLKKSQEAMRAHMEKEGELTTLRARIREGKTLDLLRANARLTLE